MDRQDRALASQSPRDFCYQWMGLPWNEWFVTYIWIGLLTSILLYLGT